MQFIDTHCHLTAFSDEEFVVLRRQAAEVGVRHCVMVAAHQPDWAQLPLKAAVYADSYALGVHPLFVADLAADWLVQLQRCIENGQAVALGEIGLDNAAQPDAIAWQRQVEVFVAQLQLAKYYGLPVIVHSRRATDTVIKYLRRYALAGGIAHAFNGSKQQAEQLIDLGFKLGFGGAVTYDRAKHLQRLVKELPLAALVAETDSPDMPPQWLYVTKKQRLAGATVVRNTPAQLPKIVAHLAVLRGCPLEDMAAKLWQNSCEALHLNPR